MSISNIETKLARATTLPVLPKVVVQVINLLDRADVGSKEYERLISQDSALTAKILRTANSALFGGGGRITSLQRALSILGINTMRSICMTVAFQSVVQSKQLTKRFCVPAYWQHSLSTACAAKILAALSRCAAPDEAFIAGLLHDIGKLAISILLPDEANCIHALVETTGLSYLDAERKQIQLDHQIIGKMAIERWGLPGVYIPPVASHHSTETVDFDESPLVACVQIANSLAHDIGFGFGPQGYPGAPDPEALRFLNVPQEQYETIRVAVAKEVERVSEMFCL